MTVRLRKVKQHDIAYLQNIDLKCFDDLYDIDTWGAINESDNETIVVALLNNTVVGFVVYGVEGPNPMEVHVYKLGVLPKWRHKGIGRKLLNHVDKYAHLVGANNISCSVPEDLITGVNDATTWLKRMGLRAKLSGSVLNFTRTITHDSSHTPRITRTRP